MVTDYRSSHLKIGKGKTYHAAFTYNPYRSMVWKFEKEILDQIMMTIKKNAEINHFDFACGTGRIIEYCSRYTRTSIGVDVSPSMLEVANKNKHNCELIKADLTKKDVLRKRKFNMITAFRFFPNAEPKLRMQAMQILTKHIENNGFIIFNNHKNVGCTRNRLARIFGHRGYKGMSTSEVKEMVAKCGLNIVNVYHMCVFPSSEKYLLLPHIMLTIIESILRKCCFLQEYGENLIYVCRRSGVCNTKRYKL